MTNLVSMNNLFSSITLHVFLHITHPFKISCENQNLKHSCQTVLIVQVYNIKNCNCREIIPHFQYKQKTCNDFHLLHFICGKRSKLRSRHWLLLNIIQLIQTFAPTHHLLYWCRNSGFDVVISDPAWNPFLRRYHLRREQTSHTLAASYVNNSMPADHHSG